MNHSEFYTLARGILVPSETEIPQFQKLAVESYHVNVSVEKKFATTEAELVFSNPNNTPVGGLFVFPLPKRTVRSKTEIYIDGDLANPRVLSSSKLTAFYTRILQARDAQTLQQIGASALKTEISPIPASGESRVRIFYTEPVENLDENLVHTPFMGEPTRRKFLDVNRH